MNREMAYLLGMICGNGEIQRGSIDTTVSIEIPHKKLATENNNDVRIYVRASITDIRNIIEPLIGTGIQFIQQDNYSVLSHEKSKKKKKGENEWLHPDLVGVYFPFNDYIKETTDLIQQFNESIIRLFSFEMNTGLTSFARCMSTFAPR